jgi:hypothetical protein
MLKAKVVYIGIILWSFLSLYTSFINMGYATGTTFGGYVALVIKYVIVLVMLLGLLRNKVGLTKGKLSKSIFIWAAYAFVITTLFMMGQWQKVYIELLWWVLLFFFFSDVAYRDACDKELTRFVHWYLPILFIGNLVVYIFGWLSTNGMMGFATVSLNHYFYVGLLLPFLFLIKNKGLKYTLFTLGFVASLISYKRSSIIFAFALFILLIYTDFVKTASHRKGAMSGIIGVLLLGGVMLFSYNKIDALTNGYISRRFEQTAEDGGSGREERYENTIERYMALPFPNKIIGIGFDGVRNKFNTNDSDIENGASAHNDFLEMLCDFGVIGLLLYLVVVINLLRMIKRCKKISETLYDANVAGLIVFFVMSMVSHLFLYGSYFGYLAILWGFSNGTQRRLGIT